MTDNEITNHLVELRDALSLLDQETVALVGQELIRCYDRDATLYLLGNGGSAATASHFACDLTKGTRQEGLRRFRAIALTDNVPLLTAWGNDASFDLVFAEQLAALLRPGDAVLAITASGNSPNVLEAIETARRAGARAIAWTGATGGKVADLAELVVRVPARTIEQVEDGHMVLAHALTVYLRARLRERTLLQENVSAARGTGGGAVTE